MAIDPVCGMNVDEEKAEWTSTHDGITYYFCKPGCKNAFESDPGNYLDNTEQGMKTQHHEM